MADLTATTRELAEIEVASPATGRVVGSVPDMTATDVAVLVAQARAAQPAWADLGFAGRADHLDRLRRWLVANEREVIDVMLSETGKVYEDAQLEVVYVAALLSFWAKHAKPYLAEQRFRRPLTPFTLGRTASVRRVPLGVVGVIGPWNFPLANNFSDAVAPLAAGNGVVLKPSEITPLSSLLMLRAARECGWPDGIFAVATGRGETGAALVDEADGIMFTGSARTGRLVGERAARGLKPACLELGGKDPMVVLADADLERAANAAVYWSVMNSGQLCLAVERVYVEAPAYADFVARVGPKVRALRHGASTEPGRSDVGAVIFPPQLDTIDAHVRDAVDKGARVVVGGRVRPGDGQYYEPTVLVDVDHSMTCMREETFGPVLPIMEVRDADEAIMLANDSSYGLGASLWTADRKRGEVLARRLEAGGVCVNDHNVNNFAFALPQSGWKSSGLGSRHSPDGIRKFTRTQTIMTTHIAPKRELYMYPHTKRAMRLQAAALRLLYGRR